MVKLEQAIVCHKLIFAGLLNLFPWGPPEAGPEARAWKKVFYLGGNARKHRKGVGK